MKAAVCPNCGSTASSIAYRAADYNKKMSDEVFEYYRCAKCGVVFLHEIPKNLGDYYPANYYDLPRNPTELAETAERLQAWKLATVMKHSNGGSLLEIGAAYGLFSHLAKPAGFQVTAIEMDSTCREFLRNVVGVDVVEGRDTIEALRSLQKFDVIVMWQVLEHLPDAFAVMSEAADRLSPGGLLILDTPNPEAFQFRVLGHRWAHLDAPRHVVLIPASVLTAHLSKHGLKPELLTASDFGANGFNGFGWAFTFKNYLGENVIGRLSHLFGRVLAKLLIPMRGPGGEVAPTLRFFVSRDEYQVLVLLPTRNRLEYLRYAVETVRRQDYADWEIVVSDNCSEDDIEAYVRLLDDPRVVYVRTQTFVPVTDNWNNALAHSTGDYVVMLGDDDGLMPNYFSKLLGAMERFPDPDFVYVSALFFAYPGVMPDAPDGFLREDSNRVFGKREPFWLDEATALSIVRGYLDLRMPVASNMQFSLISRRKVEQLSRAGGFFQSPYPDFYATPALFLTSSRILVYAEPMVIIGITPKSYGYFHFNNRAADGVKFLNNVDALADFATLKSVFLPGTSYNDSWLLAAQALSTNHGRERNLTPNYRRYRFLQIVHCYKRCYLDRSLTSADVAQLRRHMTVAETLMYAPAFRLGFGALGFIPGKLRARVLRSLRRMIGQHAIKESSDATPKFNDIVEAYESLDLRSTRPIAERAS